MKRSLSQIVLALAVLLYCTRLFAAGMELLATVEPVKGSVAIQLPGRSFEDIKSTKQVPSGTTVRTGAQSEAVVRWSNGNVVKLSSFTSLRIEGLKRDLASGDEQSKMFLWNGDVVAKAKKLTTPASNFQMETPSAVAGVRGTKFRAQVTASEESNFWCTEGEVDISAQGVTVAVKAGDKTTVKKGETPTQAEQITVEEEQAVNDALSTVEEKPKEGGETGAEAEGTETEGTETEGTETEGTETEGTETEGTETEAATLETVEVDTQPPALTITSPVSGLVTRSDQINIMGRSESGARIMAGGASVIAGQGGGFQLAARLMEGDNEIIVQAADNSGNISVQTITVTRDTTPPMLTITEPPERFAVKAGASCEMSGAGSMVCRVGGITESGARLKINDVAYPVEIDGSFRTRIQLSFTATEIKVEVSDQMGNRKITVLKRAVDYSQPSFVSVACSKDSLVSNGQTRATISVTVKNFLREPIQGAMVILSLDPPQGGIIAPVSGITGANGVFTAELTAGTSRAPLQGVITATSGEIQARAQVQFVPDRPETPE